MPWTRPGFRGAAAAVRRSPSPSAWSTWPWEPTRPGRVVSLLPSTGLSGSRPPSAWSRPRGPSRRAPRSTASACLLVLLPWPNGRWPSSPGREDMHRIDAPIRKMPPSGCRCARSWRGHLTRCSRFWTRRAAPITRRPSCTSRGWVVRWLRSTSSRFSAPASCCTKAHSSPSVTTRSGNGSRRTVIGWIRRSAPSSLEHVS